MSGSGDGGAFWSEFKRKQEAKRLKRIERRAANSEFKRLQRRVGRDRMLANAPEPTANPLPQSFRGKQIYELSDDEKVVYAYTRGASFSWLALIELEATCEYWRWHQLARSLGYQATRSNVLRILTQLEWRVRMKAREEPKGEGPFNQLLFEATEDVRQMPCRGPGRPGRRAGVSPFRRTRTTEDPPTLDEIMPEAVERHLARLASDDAACHLNLQAKDASIPGDGDPSTSL